jgi:hypothetical protein
MRFMSSGEFEILASAAKPGRGAARDPWQCAAFNCRLVAVILEATG